jgi:outer membrane protein assembly factor BamB
MEPVSVGGGFVRRLAFFIVIFMVYSMITPNKASNLTNCSWTCYMKNPEHSAIISDDCGVDPNKTDLLWQNMPEDIEKDGRSIEAPAVYKDGFVYFGRHDQNAHETYTSKFVKADANTGDVIWQFSIDNPNPATCSNEFFVAGLVTSPVLSDDKVYFAAVNSDIYCLNQEDGSLVWKSKNSTPTQDKNHDPKKGSYVRSSPAIYKDKLLVAVSFQGFDYKNNIETGSFDIFTFDAKTGENKLLLSTEAYLFEKDTKEYIAPDDCAMRSALTIANDKLFVSTTKKLLCFDLLSKKILWSHNVNPKQPFFCTPTVVDDKIYYGSPNNDFYCYGIQTGDFKWSSKSKLSIRNGSTPLVIGNRIIIPHCNGKVVCLGDDGQTIVWCFQTEDTVNAICSSPVYSNGNIWFGSNDHNLYCLEVQTGKLIKKIKLDGIIIAPPVIVDKKIFIGTESGTFYCFGMQTSKSQNNSSETNASDSDWLCFMNSNEHTGVAPDSAGPKTNNLEKYYTLTTAFKVVPSTIIVNGTAYVGSLDNAMHAFSLSTTRELWRFSCGDKCHHDKTVKEDALKYGGVFSTPAYNDGKLYFGSICYKIFCLDAATGQVIWTFDKPDLQTMFMAPVLYHNGKIYTTASERVYCIDAKTGTKIWSAVVWNNKFSPPMIAEGKLYVAALSRLLCLDLETGQELVKDGFVHGGKVINDGSPSYRDGKVYYGTDDSDFICFDGKTGKELWRSREQRAITCASLTEDKVFFGDLFKGVTCLERSTGKELWQFKDESFIQGAPVYCAGKLYFGNMTGKFRVIETKFGKEVWSYDVKANSPAYTGDKSFACSPSFSGGKIYIGNFDGQVYCFGDTRRGLTLDKVKVEAPSDSVLVNKKIQFKATAFAIDGSIMDAKFTWSCDPSNLGSIDSNGLFTAGDKPGTVMVKAQTGKIYDQTKIVIKDIKDKVTNVSVEPKSAKLVVGDQKEFVATAFDGAGNVVEGVDFAWKVEPTTIGTIEDGLFTAQKSGKGKITATVGARSASSQVMVVKPLRMTISPESATVVAGGTQQFAATVWDDLDEKIEDAKPQWSVNPESLGTINENGLFIAGSEPGNGHIKVTFGGLEAIAPVTVNPVPIGKLEVSPISLDFGKLDPDFPKTLKITAKNTGTAEISVDASVDADWLSIKPDKATILADGEAVFEVTANVSGKSPSSAHNGKIIFKSGDQSVEVQAKAEVAPPKDCIVASLMTLFGQVTPDSRSTFEFGIKSGTGKPVDAKIESTNPKVTVNQASAKLSSELTKIILTVDSVGIKSNENIEGKMVITAGQSCKTLEIPFNFPVQNNEISIWLQIGNSVGKIDGKETPLDVPPQIIKSNTMVPLRFIAEAFGCKIDWDGNERKITITKGDFSMLLWLDKTTAKVNGADKILKAPPTSVKGRTLVPIRFIAEAFGATVNYDAQTKEISITWIPK